jgi:hypothetical protein
LSFFGIRSRSAFVLGPGTLHAAIQGLKDTKIIRSVGR